MIETTGQSWSQVREEWDLPRLEAWSRYCKKHPTLRAMVQAYLGINTERASLEEPTDILQMLSAFPGASVK